ncbi:MAG: MlaE family lipid ABC transporter permease subunit [Gammaproteobacteria bacterium]|nr:MAG: MlaE family lipid ABC transporter permease subunit [Gammaproteobacteria bacterium]
MTEQGPAPGLERGQDRIRFVGAWTLAGAEACLPELEALSSRPGRRLVFDLSGITALDTTGAWLIVRTERRLRAQGARLAREGVPERYRTLFHELEQRAPGSLRPPPPVRDGLLAALGRPIVKGFDELFAFLAFTGEAFVQLARLLPRPQRIRWRALFADMEQAGARALGIVGLLSFLMGVVIAYQAAVQLRLYGADLYVADLVGLSMVRELGPLLAAIIVAGRTGSAYAAQIGTMKVNEEIDALRTLGVSPLDVLVVPKMLSLAVSLPLLAVFGIVAGVCGGMVMTGLLLDLSAGVFLDRVADAVSLRSFLLGVGKAPVFALIIALIGCFQGFRVEGSAASVGRHTTLAVVQSIFLVIVADAQFSVFFSWLGI